MSLAVSSLRPLPSSVNSFAISALWIPIRKGVLDQAILTCSEQQMNVIDPTSKVAQRGKHFLKWSHEPLYMMTEIARASINNPGTFLPFTI